MRVSISLECGSTRGRVGVRFRLRKFAGRSFGRSKKPALPPLLVTNNDMYLIKPGFGHNFKVIYSKSTVNE